jgi:hypothetical protein
VVTVAAYSAGWQASQSNIAGSKLSRRLHLLSRGDMGLKRAIVFLVFISTRSFLLSGSFVRALMSA